MKTIKYIVAAIIILFIGIVIGKIVFNNQETNKSLTVTQSNVEEHWTCSMHPQIDLPEQTPCPICGMDLILREEGEGENLDPNQFKMNKYAMELSNIQTQTIGDDNDVIAQNSMLDLSGRIIQNQNNVALQTAHVGGRIEKLYFKTEGEVIKKGNIIALIYSPELVTAQNELIQAMEIKASQPELYMSIRKKLHHWKLSEDQITTIEQTKGVMTNYPLIANVTGVITIKYVEEGNHVMEGSKLYEVSNLNSLWAEFDVFERDIASVKKGITINIIPNAYLNKKITSKINFIDPILDPTTRTIKIRATIRNNKADLKPGMILTAEIERHTAFTEHQSLYVPKSAVLWTGKRSIVYTKPEKDKPIFELREIELGTDFGDKYEVISGLVQGEEVVVNGTFTLDAAAQLNNKASMMNVLNSTVKDEAKLPDYTSSTPKTFKQQLSGLTKSYLALKNALVNTDTKLSIDMANHFILEIKKIDMSLLKGDSHLEWMNQFKSLNAHGKKITELDDVEAQRRQFDFLSQALINSVKIFGIIGDTVYVQHCPMAFDNEGANWLSAETKIFNPYFGDKMLKCGIVKDTITKNYKNPPIEKISNAKNNLHNH